MHKRASEAVVFECWRSLLLTSCSGVVTQLSVLSFGVNLSSFPGPTNHTLALMYDFIDYPSLTPIAVARCAFTFASRSEYVFLILSCRARRTSSLLSLDFPQHPPDLRTTRRLRLVHIVPWNQIRHYDRGYTHLLRPSTQTTEDSNQRDTFYCSGGRLPLLSGRLRHNNTITISPYIAAQTELD